MRWKAWVPDDIEGEIKWLVIEYDKHDTGGYFTYYHLHENFAYDSWHASLEDALESAYGQFNIDRQDWIKIG